jgi:hypothetical protein
MKSYDHFRGIASATIGSGDTVLLWGDVWNGHHLMSELPRIFFICKKKGYLGGNVLQQLGGAPKFPYPSVTIGFRGVGNLKSNHLSGPTTTPRQIYLDLHLGLHKIHFKQILQSQFLSHSGSSSL